MRCAQLGDTHHSAKMFHGYGSGVYEIVSNSSSEDPENRLDILSGTLGSWPSATCFNLVILPLDSPTYDFRSSWDCTDTESGSHGTPVPTGNYSRVAFTNNAGNPPFTIRLTVSPSTP